MSWSDGEYLLTRCMNISGTYDDGVTGHRAKAQRAETLGVWIQLLMWARGRPGTRGYLSEQAMLMTSWPAVTARLLRARYAGMPLLHPRATGEACACAPGRDWPDGYAYLIHEYTGPGGR